MDLGVAILGMGRWGKAWARVLERTPGVRVAASARSADHPDYRDALAADGVDAVIATLPVGLHLDAIRRSVSLGRHVLCEKPAVPTPTELKQLEDLAAEGAATIRICQNYRQRPWAQAARSSVAQLGELSQVDIDFAQSEFLDGGRGILRHPVLADMAVHHVDLLRWLTSQEAQVVAARSHRSNWTTYAGAPDLTAMLTLDGGASVTYSASWAGRGRATPWDGNWRFRGERGSVTVADRIVTLDLGDGPSEVPWQEDTHDDEDLARVWAEFRAAIDGTPTAGVTIADHARTLNVVFDLAAAGGVVDPHLDVDGN